MRRRDVRDAVQQLRPVAGHVRVPGVAVDQVAVGDATRHREVGAQRLQRGVRLGELGRRPVCTGARVRSWPETVHLDVRRARRSSRGQVLDVDAGAAVHLRRELAGQQADTHGAQPSPGASGVALLSRVQTAPFGATVRNVAGTRAPRVLGIVLAGGEGKRLAPLTADRAKPAVPFGGIYRLVDFVLSNLVNGGYRQICVLTQYKSHSLDRHITTTWRMSTLLGNYVTPVPAQQRLGPRWFTGSADAIFQSLNLVYDEQPDIVVVFGADHVYRMDPTADGRAAHRKRRGPDRRRHPGAAPGGDGLRRHQDRAGRPRDRGVPREADRSAGTAGRAGRDLRLDGQLRLLHRRAARGAAHRLRRRGFACTTWAATSSRCW